MANTSGEKELKTDWPITEGLIAETTKQAGRDITLRPQGLNGLKSTISDKDRVGI